MSVKVVPPAAPAPGGIAAILPLGASKASFVLAAGGQEPNVVKSISRDFFLRKRYWLLLLFVVYDAISISWSLTQSDLPCERPLSLFFSVFRHDNDTKQTYLCSRTCRQVYWITDMDCDERRQRNCWHPHWL